VDYVHKRMKTDMLVESIISKYVEVRPAGMAIEISATFGGLWEYFWSECHKRGLSGISVLRFTPKPNQSKYERICMLQPWFKRGQIYMRKEHQEMRNQLLHYTGYKKKEKDDLIDSFAQQLFVGKMPDFTSMTETEDEYEPIWSETGY
jgi:phage terminase large subunit-like protein